MFTIDVIHCNDDRQLEQRDNSYDLLVFFSIYPISTLAIRMRSIRDSSAKVLLILDVEESITLRHIREFRVDGMVSIEEPVDEFKRAIRTIVKRNLKYVSPLLVSSFLGVKGELSLSAGLSKKELDVAVLILNGKRASESADCLYISPKTVNSYKAKIYRKLNVHNDMQFARLALLGGLFTTSQM